MFPPLLIIFTVNHEVLHSSIIFEVPFCIALFNHHDVRMKLFNEKLSIAFYFSKKPYYLRGHNPSRCCIMTAEKHIFRAHFTVE